MSKKDQLTYREILKVYEKRSTCKRLQVACVVVRDGRPIVSGWNGTLSGDKHCTDHFKDYTNEEMQTTMRETHHHFSKHNELHAETNAIAYAARKGISLEGADAYVSLCPCLPCSMLIAAAGIKKVFYENLYDRDIEGIKYLTDRGIQVSQLEQSETI